MERVPGIEPGYPAWKAGVLPLNYTRISGAEDGTRTRNFHLGKVTLYHWVTPAYFYINLERVPGIEPGYPAWKAGVLPLNYTRLVVQVKGVEPPRRRR